MSDSLHGISANARSIPLALRLRLFLSHPTAAIGLLFFCFGMIFPILFGAAADIQSLLYFRDGDPAVTARIIAIESSGSSENKRRILAYRYRFDADGGVHEGTSFSSQSAAVTGDLVPVQYVPGKPEKSRISGMRAAPFHWSVIPFTLIFPLIGAGLLYFAIRRFRRNLHLARHGIVTTGQVGRREPTNVTINQQRVYRIFFTFSDASGNKHESYVETHQYDNLGDERAEPLLYDAARPEKAVLIDSLPPALRQALG